MRIQSITEKLKRYGVAVSTAQLEVVLSDLGWKVSDIRSDADVEDLAHRVKALDSLPTIEQASSQLAKRESDLAKTDTPASSSLTLPTESQIQKMDIAQVSGWITEIENLEAKDTAQGEQIMSALALLYERRRNAIAFNRGAIQAFRQQDQELADSTNELGQALNNSLETMRQLNEFQEQFTGEGGDRLIANFRKSQSQPTLLERFNERIGVGTTTP